MVENYNLKTGFGLNVIPSQKLKIAGNKVEEAMSNLWTPLFDYLEKNENVFSGNIEAEINKINNQTLDLGNTVRKGQEQHRLDEKG